jgi:hypothetical protein
MEPGPEAAMSPVAQYVPTNHPGQDYNISQLDRHHEDAPNDPKQVQTISIHSPIGTAARA